MLDWTATLLDAHFAQLVQLSALAPATVAASSTRADEIKSDDLSTIAGHCRLLLADLVRLVSLRHVPLCEEMQPLRGFLAHWLRQQAMLTAAGTTAAQRDGQSRAAKTDYSVEVLWI